MMRIHEIAPSKHTKIKRFNNFQEWKAAVSDAANGQYKMESDRVDDIFRAIKHGIIVGQWDGKDNEGWVTDYNYEYGQLTLAKLRKLFEV